MEENEFILESARRMEAWEKAPKPAGDDYADMNRDELIKLIEYLRERLEETEACRKENDRRISELTDRISGLTEMLRQSNEHASVMAAQLSGLVRQLREKDRKIAELESTAKAARTVTRLRPIRMRKRILTARRNPCRLTLTWMLTQRLHVRTPAVMPGKRLNREL